MKIGRRDRSNGRDALELTTRPKGYHEPMTTNKKADRLGQAQLEQWATFQPTGRPRRPTIVGDIALVLVIVVVLVLTVTQ